MTASRDPDRLIRAFLVEGQYELADRVYDVVRSEIDASRQRVVIVPWRTPRMPTSVKLMISAAAVVVAAVIGINLLGANNGSVGGEPTPPPATPVPTPTASPTPTPTEPSFGTSAPFAPSGPLELGRHTFTSGGLRFSVDIQTTGWVSNGQFAIDREAGITADGAGFILWPATTPIGVFADPCTSTEGPVIGPSPGDLAAAVAALPGTDLVEAPTDVTVGGYPAKHVAITVREDIGCVPTQFYMWYGSGPDDARYATELGSTVQSWIIDVNGTIAWIDGETYKGAGPEPVQLIQQVIDSVQFE
jgi:hypothetical protein